MSWFAITRPDGKVELREPSLRAIRVYHSGAGPDREKCKTDWWWNMRRRGFLEEQERRQIEAGHAPDAVRRHIQAMSFGGLTTNHALQLIHDRDCAHRGTGIELIDTMPFDRWFRNAWRRSPDGGPIWIDLDAARIVQQQRIAGSTANRLFNRHDAQMVGGSAKLFAQSEKEGCA